MVLLAYVQVVREVNIKGWNYAHVLDRAVEREVGQGQIQRTAT
jgi:hypothetical protein